MAAAWQKSIAFPPPHHHHISIVFIHHQEIDPPAENRAYIITWRGPHRPKKYYKTCPTGEVTWKWATT